MHKSNSTYFTDLDASRSYLLSALCYDGLVTVDRELAAEGKKGMLAAIIGSVTTSFTILQRDHQDAATTLLFKHSAIIQVNHGSPQQVINIKTMKGVRVL